MMMLDVYVYAVECDEQVGSGGDLRRDVYMNRPGWYPSRNSSLYLPSRLFYFFPPTSMLTHTSTSFFLGVRGPVLIISQHLSVSAR